MRRLCCSFMLLLLGNLSACGGSSAGSNDVAVEADTQQGPIKTDLPLVTKQSTLTVDEFVAVVGQDTSLTAIWNALKAKGATAFLSAGISQDEDGVVVQWGQATDSQSNSGVLQRCLGNDCVEATFSVSNGSLALADATGKPVTLDGIGLPILIKQLAGHTYDKPTEVLKQALDLPSAMPVIDVSKRHAYLVSSFGSLWAQGELSLEPIETLLSQSNAFDAVTLVEYAQMADLDDTLLHAHPFDVMVWLAQTVREEVKTNQIFMPVGLTVNAGVFGDRLYDRDRLEDVLALNPLQGPGVMVLAGCESMDDGNGGGLQPKAMPKVLDNGARVVVGFVKCGDARDILHASKLFLQAFVLDQKPLGDSVAEVNVWLETLGGSLRMATLPEANLASTFLKDPSAFWDLYTTAGVPKDSFISVYMNIVNKCTGSDGIVYQEDEAFATAWTKNITWDGPFFSGSRSNPDNNVDITISGALVSLEEGAHFFFTLTGDLGPKVNNLTLYGSAEIQKIRLDKKKPDEFVIEFTGQGFGSEYINEKGDTCIMQPPYLMTTTGEPSTFTIPVPWTGN